MKYKHPSFLLAVILTSAAPIFADRIPTASKNESRDAVFAQASAEKQGLHDLYAAGDCGLSGTKQNEVRFASMSDSRTGGFTQGDKSMSLGALVNSGANSSNHPVTVVDLGSNDRKFSHLGKGKSRGKGDADTDGGGSTAASAIAVPEPGSRLLLLVGLAGLGVFFLRRNAYQNAIE
ncbi:MAG TPA: PEP-CTERM sorting domain-containing protein [Candidatus Acidoferrales bacterium]|jgi:hypothetical protein|nr:PEP-CTERM sorting domain-containing protein [Candidatus Acidoferrales bacterium]